MSAFSPVLGEILGITPVLSISPVIGIIRHFSFSPSGGSLVQSHCNFNLHLFG